MHKQQVSDYTGTVADKENIQKMFFLIFEPKHVL